MSGEMCSPTGLHVCALTSQIFKYKSFVSSVLHQNLRTKSLFDVVFLFEFPLQFEHN